MFFLPLGKPSNMKKKGAQTRALILDTAEGLVLAHGLQGTALHEIAAAAKLTKGAVYYHFPDKDSLARALVARATAEDLHLLAAFVESASRLHDEPFARAMHVLRMLEDHLAALHVPWGSLRAALAYQSMEFSEETERAVARNFACFTRLFTALFDQMIEARPPAYRVAAATLAESLVAAMEGGALLARVHADPKRAARPVALFRRQLQLCFRRERARDPSKAQAE
jgi:TetR/AcrR family transcriptional repressor of nem operon